MDNSKKIKVVVKDTFIKKVKEIIMQGTKVPKAYIKTYGCVQNVQDGDRLKAMVELMGYSLIKTSEEADLIIFNTCAVRENAEDKVFGNLGALKHKKKKNPNMIIGVCGCMTQQEHIAKKIKTSYPFVSLIFGTHAIKNLPEMIYNSIKNKKKSFDLDMNQNGFIPEGLPIKREGKLKAFIPIMYGCNNFCTYCVVPLVRGREISRESSDIIDEVKMLVDEGYCDITLLGQNVNSYGKTLEEDINFCTLLEKINAIEGKFRIRFLTSHPKDATYELIDTIKKCEKVCNHFHLPVQSGSDRILTLMNRHYNNSQYLDLVKYAKEKIPEISFTSDIIVGFPGEEYEDLQKTIELIKEVRYDALFTFIFSKRVGTKAYDMLDNIDDKTKSNWFSELLSVQSKISKENLKSHIGKTYEILVEGTGRTDEKYKTGKTASNLIVDFIGDDELIGKFVTVKIIDTLSFALFGEITDEIQK